MSKAEEFSGYKNGGLPRCSPEATRSVVPAVRDLPTMRCKVQGINACSDP